MKEIEQSERLLMEKNSIQTEEKYAFLTLRQLCDYLPSKPSKSTIYAKVNQRKIPHKKVNGRLLFKKSEIDSWIEEHGRFTAEERVENLFINRKRA